MESQMEGPEIMLDGVQATLKSSRKTSCLNTTTKS
uniref:Uncharacterized protein n=1 Tax=Anguilla anguilla TaxID=7936 RepID=A0A0E9VI97_ANGAN